MLSLICLFRRCCISNEVGGLGGEICFSFCFLNSTEHISMFKFFELGDKNGEVHFKIDDLVANFFSRF
jgi:hypothetical protein